MGFSNYPLPRHRAHGIRVNAVDPVTLSETLQPGAGCARPGGRRDACTERAFSARCARAGLRPYGDAPDNGVTPKRVHWHFVDDFTGQVAGLGIARQQSLPFKISTNALCDALRQFGQLGARGRVDPLGLQTYFTEGEKEVRAWTIRKGDTAPQAAGVNHADFEKGFIRAFAAQQYFCHMLNRGKRKFQGHVLM